MQARPDILVPSLMGIGMGVPMGMAFIYSGTYHPDVVQAQLRRENWDMFKTFMSAVSVGGVCIALLNSTSNAALVSRPLHMAMTPLGGALLGTGMYLTGACPGTIWAQLGAGIKGNSLL